MCYYSLFYWCDAAEQRGDVDLYKNEIIILRSGYTNL